MTEDESGSDGADLFPAEPFPGARREVESHRARVNPAATSPSYRLAFEDIDFLLRQDLRPVRLQLEMLKPELLQQEHGIRSTVAVFGSSRIPDPAAARRALDEAEAAARARPRDAAAARHLAVARRRMANSRYYEEARRLGHLITESGGGDMVVKTGGGPGIMEAANRGAADVGGKSIGLNIVLPMEQEPNPYVTPDLCFLFHYFAIRKMHFMARSKALVVFPGGFGTLDELFEAATLIQTGKIDPIPILLFGREYWERIINLDAMVGEGVISPEDLAIFTFVETADEAWSIIGDYGRADPDSGGDPPAGL